MVEYAESKWTFISRNKEETYRVEREIPTSNTVELQSDPMNFHFNEDQIPSDLEAGTDIMHWGFVITIGDETTSGEVSEFNWKSEDNLRFSVDKSL